MTVDKVRHRTLQVANHASLLLLSRLATAIGLPLMLFFASQLWTGVEEMKVSVQAFKTETSVALTEMRGDMRLMQYRIDTHNRLGGTHDKP